MDNRLELIEEYQKAKIACEKAEAHLEAVKIQLKECGTFSEGGYDVDVSVTVSARVAGLSEIRRSHPNLAILLDQNGLIKRSESERLTVKLKEDKK